MIGLSSQTRRHQNIKKEIRYELTYIPFSLDQVAKGNRLVVVHDKILCKKIKLNSKYIFMLNNIGKDSLFQDGNS